MNKWVNQKDFFVWAGIDIDSPGRLWIGTAPAGIIIYDPDHHSARLLFPNDSAQQQNISDANVYLYCDRNGIVWSGAWERRGIYEITPFSPAVTPEGLTFLIHKTGTFNVFRKKDLPRLPEDNIIPFSVDTVSHKAWISNFNLASLYEMDLVTKKCRPIIFKDSANQPVTINGLISNRYGRGCVSLVDYNENKQGIFIYK